MARIAFDDTRDASLLCESSIHQLHRFLRESYMHHHRAWPYIETAVRTIVMIVVFVGASGSLGAQWFTVPSPRAPRTANGDVDLTAATPRLANGKPDLSGVWMTAEPLCVIRGTAPI